MSDRPREEIPMRGGGSATYSVQEFATELDVARENHDIGSTVWFENDHVRVWEVRLEPGQRAPFHSHAHTYFWTCVDPGTCFQRFPDGTAEAFAFALGETMFNTISADDPMIHDLENTDDHVVRFVAVELKDL
jgi:beta-alanine degradation protein BauB